jgi:hypothetical protein
MVSSFLGGADVARDVQIVAVLGELVLVTSLEYPFSTLRWVVQEELLFGL